jgi:hypothetical protein
LFAGADRCHHHGAITIGRLRIVRRLQQFHHFRRFHRRINNCLSGAFDARVHYRFRYL